MSDLVAIAYDKEDTAARVLEELRRLQSEHLIDLEDAVSVTRNGEGKVKLNQSTSLTGMGAAGGALWGTLFGMLLFTPILGMAIGAGFGALSGKLSDVGVDDKFAKQLGDQLQPNTSALLVLVRRVTPDKVLEQVGHYGGTVIRTSLSNDAETRLRNALGES